MFSCARSGDRTLASNITKTHTIHLYEIRRQTFRFPEGEQSFRPRPPCGRTTKANEITIRAFALELFPIGVGFSAEAKGNSLFVSRSCGRDDEYFGERTIKLCTVGRTVLATIKMGFNKN